MNKGACLVASRCGRRRPWRVVLRATTAIALAAPTGATATTGGFATDHALRQTMSTGAAIEMIAADAVNGAYDRVVASDVRYRFVIDAATIG
jgi:D-arabinose 1-dehydrogenase-like Zn-dependent alcohol dehydrogenase